MRYTLNQDMILQLIKAQIEADATLPGVNYVNGTVSVYTRRAPNNAEGKYFVVDLAGPVPDDNGIIIGELRVYFFLEKMANGQVSSAGDRVLSRCEELLGDYQYTDSLITVQPLLSRGYTAPTISPDDDTRAMGVLRMRLEAGPNE